MLSWSYIYDIFASKNHLFTASFHLTVFSLFLCFFLPGFIRNLIEKKHWIDAIKYINALKMEDKFPLVSLVTDYLAYWENRADAISKKQNSSPRNQVNVAMRNNALTRSPYSASTLS